MQDPVHGLVRDLGRPLIVEQVQRSEGNRVEARTGAGVAQVLRHAIAQRRYPFADAGARRVPAEQLSELPSDREERAHGAERAVR